MVVGAWLFFQLPSQSSTGLRIVGGMYLVYLIFSVIAYAIILSRLRMSRRKSRRTASTTTPRNRLCRLLRQQGFVTPFLICITYIILCILPGFAIQICSVLHMERCVETSRLVWTEAYIFNTLTDTLIYVFCDKAIRQHIRKILRRKTRIHCRSDTPPRIGVTNSEVCKFKRSTYTTSSSSVLFS